MDEDQAASRLQSIKRGQAARAQTQAMKEEKQAATKMQAAKRGKDARESVKSQRDAAAVAAAAEHAAKEAEASERLGAGAKGYMQRKRQKKEQEEMAAATTRIQAGFRGKKQRDPNSEANVRRQRREDDPSFQAEKYLSDHKLLGLFDLLGQKLVSERPKDPRGFLVDELTKLKQTKHPSSPMNFFDSADIDTLYSMYDVSGRGLTRAQAHEAFEAIGVKVKLPPAASKDDLVSQTSFMALLPK